MVVKIILKYQVNWTFVLSVSNIVFLFYFMVKT